MVQRVGYMQESEGQRRPPKAGTSVPAVEVVRNDQTEDEF